MRKTISFSVLCFLSVAAFGAGDAEAVQASPSISLFEIIASGGIVSIVAWTALSWAFPLSLLLGVASSISSTMSKKPESPLTFKLLLLAAAFNIFVATVNISFEMSTALKFATARNAIGAAKQRVLALTISDALYTAAFALLATLAYLFFIAIASITSHFAKKRLLERANHTADPAEEVAT